MINATKMGAVMKRLRTKKELTHKNFESVMSRAYLTQIEAGKATPGMAKFLGWCEVMNMPGSVLLATLEKFNIITYEEEAE